MLPLDERSISKLGKLLHARVPWYELRPGIGRVGPYTPDWLDY